MILNDAGFGLVNHETSMIHDYVRFYAEFWII